MKIAIMGSGGLGGYIGGRLAQAGNKVTFIARGPQLEALQQDGLQVKSVMGDFHLPSVRASHDPAAVGPVDLILLSVKSYDLATAAEALRPMLGAETVILPVLNGIDHVSALNEMLGPEHVLGGLTSMTAHVLSPGLVERIGDHGIFQFGEQAGGRSPRVAALQAVLGIDGLNGQASTDIMAAMWQKLALICGANIWCVVRGDKTAVWRGMPETGRLIRQAISEVVRVAQAQGIALTEAAIEAAMNTLESTPPQFKPSMLLGLERGQQIEVEALNGAVVRYGQAVDVPTPVNGFVYACLKPYVGG